MTEKKKKKKKDFLNSEFRAGSQEPYLSENYRCTAWTVVPCKLSYKLCHNLLLRHIITLSGIRTITAGMVENKKSWDNSSMAYLVKANTNNTFLRVEISLYSPF